MSGPSGSPRFGPSIGAPSGIHRWVAKWGPFVAIMASVALLGVLVVVRGGSEAAPADPARGVAGTGNPDSGDPTGRPPGEPGAPEPLGRMPPTYAEAVEAGSVDEHEWGDRCDTSEGTVMVPTVYAPPCVPLFDGDNGGATSTGVSTESIEVVWYDVTEAGGLESLLGGAELLDSSDAQFSTLSDWFELFSAVTETYRREVRLERFEATGGLGDSVASLADAERIAQDIQPFAVLGGPTNDGGAFARELARNGIICLGCALGMPECTVLDNAPYLWGVEPSTAQFVAGVRAWMRPGPDNAGLSGRAEFAGDPQLASQERRFGVVHFDQDPPVMMQCPDSRPWPDDFTVESYLLDFATMGQQGAEIAAKMASAGVTTVIFAGDPLMPIYLTNAAEAIDYHPEWIFTGTVLTDTNTFGRLYDQSQMAHAFGLSQTGVPVASGAGGALHLYRWYFGEDAFPDAATAYPVLLANVPRLFRGIQLAGPDLTPETFERAQFRIPPAGGDPVNPQQSNGSWGFFDEVDYNGTDDLAEIWWDTDAEGPDETDKVGRGMWRYARSGARFTPDDPPDPAPFDPTDTVTRFEVLPEQSRPADHPPPADAPGAGG